MPRAADVLAEATSQVAPLAYDVNVAAWEVNVDANPATEKRRLEAELALQDVLSQRELYDRVNHALANGADPLEHRQLSILRNVLLPRQLPESLRHRIAELEISVEADFNTHRGLLAGVEVDDNTIREALRSSDSPSERRDAWAASKTIGGVVSARVAELAHLRNEAARSLGYRDWFALAVSVMEMDEERLFATLAETDAVTAEPFARWKDRVDSELAKRFRCDPADLKPWHYDDPFFQEVPAAGGIDLDDVFTDLDVVRLAAQTFGELGLEADGILRASDLAPRPGKCQHAFCLDVDRRGDVRVLANVRDNYYWAETMLHELGHGVHGLRYGEDLPWLLRDAHLTVTEGIAILMGRLASDPAWLGSVAGLGREAGGLAAELRARLASELLVFTRWVLVMTNFERAFYANPDQDLGELWWRLVRRYQRLAPPDDPRPDDWAAKSHIACSPVYYHTYLYGNVIASQIGAKLREHPGGVVGRPLAGQFLETEIFRPGESLRWDDLVTAATGEPLTVRHYAADIAAGQPTSSL